MKVNSHKSHFFMSGKIDNNRIESEDTHELVGITIYLKLTFETNINEFAKKTSQKLDAFARTSNYLTFDKGNKDNNESFHYITI